MTASFVSSMRHSMLSVLSPLTPKLTAFIGRNSLFHSAAPSRSQHSVMESPTNRMPHSFPSKFPRTAL